MIAKEITDEKLLSHLSKIEKDAMNVFIMAEGRFRGAFFNGTKLINQMKLQHDLGLLETMILGQGLLCAALMIQTMKGKEHLVLKYETDGPCKGFSVEVDSSGYVRGFLFNDHIPLDKPLESWDLTPFLGNGTVTVTRYIEGAREPQISTTEIVYKNIAKDIAYFYSQSEQINTAFNTSIQFDKDGMVTGAGGLFLQSIPAAGGKLAENSKNVNDEIKNFAQMTEDELITRAENAFKAMPSIGTWFSEGGNFKDVILGLFREFNPKIVLERDIIFDCPCSIEKFTDQIKHLPKSELDDIIKNGPDPIEVICHNCSSVYHITKDMLTS